MARLYMNPIEYSISRPIWLFPVRLPSTPLDYAIYDGIYGPTVTGHAQ